MLITTQILNSCITHKALEKFEGSTVLCEVIKWYPKRSLQSNRYYWLVLNQTVETISEHTGYTKDELHQSFKEMFLTIDFNNVLTGEEKTRIKSTTELNSKEFCEYLENVMRFCAEKFGIEIKTPEQYYEK